MADNSPTTIIPMTASAVLLLGILGSWTLVYVGGIWGVYSWAVLVQLAVPVLGLFALPAMLFYAFKYRENWQYVGLALSLSVAAIYPGVWQFGLGSRTFPADPGSTQPAATVRLPSNEPLVVLWGGNTIDVNYHATYPDQRWAYDLAVEPVLTGSDKLEDYGCFGTPVIAPANAKVWSTKDGQPDQKPGVMSGDYQNGFGNHVVLELSGGTYLVLAHLQKGSVSVEKGESVAEGQLLGRCGNSGNTSEPHIHIHHQRQDPVLHPIGFSEGLPLYFRDHTGTLMPQGGIVVEGDQMTAKGDRLAHKP